MPTLAQEFKDYSERASQAKAEAMKQLKDADAQGNDQLASQLASEFQLLSTMFEEKKSAFEVAHKVQKEEILKGIETGTGIGYKPITSYIPEFGMGEGGMSYGRDESFKELAPSKNTPSLLKQQLAELLDTGESNINLDQGLDASDMLALDALGDTQAQSDYLKQKGRFETAIPINIGGNNNFIVGSREKGYSLTNPLGVTLKGTATGLATEVLPAIAGIASATTAGTAAAAAPPAVPFAAAAGYAAGDATVRGAQTALARSLYGVPIRPADIALDQAKYAAIGIPLDLATGGGYRFIKSATMKNSGDAIVNEVAKSLDDAGALLKKSGVEVPETGIPFYQGRGKYYQEIIGTYPKSRLAYKAEKGLESIGKWQEALKGKYNKTPQTNITAQIRANQDSLANDLARATRSVDARLPSSSPLANSKGWLGTRLNRIRPPEESQRKLGSALLPAVTDARVAATNAKNDAYNTLFDAADQAGISFQPAEVADLIRPVLDEAALAKNPNLERVLEDLANADINKAKANELSAEIAGIEQAGDFVNESLRTQLRDLERFSNPFSARQMDELKKQVQKMVPDNMVGTTEVDNLSRSSAEAIRTKLQSTLSDTPETAAKFADVESKYQKFLAFERDDPKSILASAFGASKLDESQMVSKALADPLSANNVLGAIRNTGQAQQADQLQALMRDAYIEKIGLTSAKGIEFKGANYDPAMIDTLWGNSAPRIKQTLNEIQEIMTVKGAKGKVSMGKDRNVYLDKDDVDKILQPISEQERRSLIKSLYKKNQSQQALDAEMGDKLVKEAMKGNGRALDSEILGDELLSHPVGNVIALKKNLQSMEQKKSLEANFMSAFFNKFATTGKNQTKNGYDLFDQEAFLKAAKGWKRGQANQPTLLKNMDVIAGKDMTDMLMAAAVQQRALKPASSLGGAEMRFIVHPEKGSVTSYMTNIPESMKHRFMGMIYASGNMRPLLRAQARGIPYEQYEEMMVKSTQALFKTRAGMKVLATQSSTDPELEDQIAEIYKIMGEEERNKK